MISIEEAKEIIDANAIEPRCELCQLEDALFCYLAEDIHAPEDSPRYTSSAMDGYAARWQDVMAASPENPVFLSLLGESQAGIPFSGNLTEGTAIRISTGAVVPASADTVIRIEDTREEGNQVAVLAKIRQGQDIRRQGEDFSKGALLFQRGRQLTARELALLASVGKSQVMVYSRPRVALLITGTELVHYTDTSILPHQIRDSNSVMLAAAIREYGAHLTVFSLVQDSLDETVAAISKAFSQNVDIILCSGGVSVGRHDHVKDAARQLDFTELFWKISQKPGKPLFFSKKASTLLFGLPGNPVSAFMCLNNYVRPVISHCLGTSFPERTLTGCLAETISNTENRAHLIRVRITTAEATLPAITPLGKQGAHMISGLAEADGYIVLQPRQSLAAGVLVEATLF